MIKTRTGNGIPLLCIEGEMEAARSCKRGQVVECSSAFLEVFNLYDLKRHSGMPAVLPFIA